MVTRKYTRDYRIETYIDARGRLRERPVYCGAYYRFIAESDTIRKNTIFVASLILAATLTTLVPMLIRCEYAKQLYVFMPQAFALIPLYMFCAALRRILMANGQVTREHRDKIVNRLNSAAVFFLIVSVLSGIGAIVFCVLTAPKMIDCVAMGLNVLRLATALAILQRRKMFAMEESRPSSELPEKLD